MGRLPGAARGRHRAAAGRSVAGSERGMCGVLIVIIVVSGAPKEAGAASCLRVCVLLPFFRAIPGAAPGLQRGDLRSSVAPICDWVLSQVLLVCPEKRW